jgi:hypothetical protein
MALDPVRLQQPVHPETVQPSFLDHDDFDRYSSDKGSLRVSRNWYFSSSPMTPSPICSVSP